MIDALAARGIEIEPDGLRMKPKTSRFSYLAVISDGMGREEIGAGEGIRTLDPNLGKVVLYP